MRNTTAKIPVVFTLKDNALKKAEKGLGHLESKAKHFAKGIASLALAGGIEEFARRSVEAAVKMEAANAKLGVALKNIGQASALGGESIKKTNEQMASLGFTGADSAQALANLVTVTHDLSKAQDLMGKAADVARYKQIPLAEAATKLARASAGSAKGLAEFGIKLDKTLKPADAFAKAMRTLNAEISGQASAYAATYAGKLDILKAKFEEVQVKVGEKLLPILIKLGDWIINTGIPDLQAFFGFIGDHQDAVLSFASAVTAVAIAFKSLSIYAALSKKELIPLLARFGPEGLGIAGGAAALPGAVKGMSKFFKSIPNQLQNFVGASVGLPTQGKTNVAQSPSFATRSYSNPMGRTFGGNAEKPSKWQLEANRLAKEANALADKKAKTDKAAAQAALVNKRLAAQFDLTQIQLAAALKGNLTQEQIDKVKALQSLEDDGYKTADQQLADQQAALDKMLATKQALAQVDIMRSVSLTSGTAVNGGGTERAGGQTPLAGSGASQATGTLQPSVNPAVAAILAAAGVGNPASSVPAAPSPSPAITAAVTQLATSSSNGMTGRTASENPITAAPQVTINVAGSVTAEQDLLNTIYNGLGNKLRAGAAWYSNAATG